MKIHGQWFLASRTAEDVHHPPPCMNRIHCRGSPCFKKYPPGLPSKHTAPCFAASVSMILSHVFADACCTTPISSSAKNER